MVWRFLHFVIEVYFLACVVGCLVRAGGPFGIGNLDTP